MVTSLRGVLVLLLLLAFAPRRRRFDACPFTQGAKASTTAATASAEKIRCGLGAIVRGSSQAKEAMSGERGRHSSTGVPSHFRRKKSLRNPKHQFNFPRCSYETLDYKSFSKFRLRKWCDKIY